MMTPGADYAFVVNDLGMTFNRNSPFQTLLHLCLYLNEIKQSLISLSFIFNENNDIIIFFLRNTSSQLKIHFLHAFKSSYF